LASLPGGELTVQIPETRYAAAADGVQVAYQVFGDGPVDLVWVPGFVSNVEYAWRYPPSERFFRRLSSFARVIMFDKRGTGLSDRVSPDYIPDLETRMDDVRAVMEAAGCESAVILGVSEGGPMSILFAATYPERTVALVVYGASPRYAWAPDYLGGRTDEAIQAGIDDIRSRWGSKESAADELASWAAPSAADDPDAIEWFAGYIRAAGSPGAGVALEMMNREIDVRDVLSAIQVPALVIQREGDRDVTAPPGYMAERIPGCKLVVLPGDDHIPWFGDAEAIVSAIQGFVGEVRDEEASFSRVLATVLFTDIVDSTAQAAAMGDRDWRRVGDEHDRIVRSQIARYQGREVKAMGDGFLATFDGPARAIRCATGITDAVKRLGIEVRAGLHTGECEMLGDDVGGIAVATGARVGALAGPSEVLVSQTVKDLVAGSGLSFEDAGEHELKGVPDRWRLYRVIT